MLLDLGPQDFSSSWIGVLSGDLGKKQIPHARDITALPPPHGANVVGDAGKKKKDISFTPKTHGPTRWKNGIRTRID